MRNKHSSITIAVLLLPLLLLTGCGANIPLLLEGIIAAAEAVSATLPQVPPNIKAEVATYGQAASAAVACASPVVQAGGPFLVVSAQVSACVAKVPLPSRQAAPYVAAINAALQALAAAYTPPPGANMSNKMVSLSGPAKAKVAKLVPRALQVQQKLAAAP